MRFRFSRCGPVRGRRTNSGKYPPARAATPRNTDSLPKNTGETLIAMSKNKHRNEYSYLGQSKPRRRSVWLILLDTVLVVLTLLCALGLVFAYIAPAVNPNRCWIFSFFGLVAPVLYAANLILMLVWAIRWRFWFFVPLIVLLCGLGNLGRMLQLRGEHHYADTVADDMPPREWQLRVMTYNIHGFLAAADKSHASYLAAMDSIAAYIRAADPDVICFQEYETMSRADVERLDRLMSDWPHCAFNIVMGDREEAAYGTAIFSRLPIIRADQMRFPESANSMVWADIKFAGDTVRVFNNHLQTTQVDSESQRRIERFEIEQDPRKLARTLAGRLRANYRRRADQADTLSKVIAQTAYPVVIAGDFNDTPLSYTYLTMRGSLEDAFVRKGSGYAYTYNPLFSVLRIDYIFYSPSFEALSYTSEKLPFSDHNPVVVTLTPRPFEE